MYLKIQGLVVRATAYSDTDLLLTLLTADQGKITAKVRGARRKNSRYISCSQLLAYCAYTLFEYRGMYTVNEAQTIALFPQLQKDLNKLSLATYFAQAAEVIAQEDTPTAGLLSLLLNSLYALDKDLAADTMIKAVFELRLACISGYEPDLRGCVHCGREVPDRFNVFEGHLECSGCGGTVSKGIRMPVTPGVLDAMRYICYCQPNKLFSFRISQQNIERLSELTESYLSAQLERGFSALDFYKSLNIPIMDCT